MGKNDEARKARHVLDGILADVKHQTQPVPPITVNGGTVIIGQTIIYHAPDCPDPCPVQRKTK
jgi:hypothetical protein